MPCSHRKRHRHPDRRHHGKSLFRSQQGSGQPIQAVSATAPEPEDLHRLLQRALSDAERGYGPDRWIDPQAADHLVDVANGDARSLLNALELAVESLRPMPAARCRSTGDGGEPSGAAGRAYDKHGDAHYDTISAFIKSLRGSIRMPHCSG